MAKEIRNIGASVRARLLQIAKASGQSFDLVLTRFALERLLFRLSQSRHADRFVLKGAVLMMNSALHRFVCNFKPRQPLTLPVLEPLPISRIGGLLPSYLRGKVLWGISSSRDRVAGKQP